MPGFLVDLTSVGFFLLWPPCTRLVPLLTIPLCEAVSLLQPQDLMLHGVTLRARPYYGYIEGKTCE